MGKVLRACDPVEVLNRRVRRTGLYRLTGMKKHNTFLGTHCLERFIDASEALSTRCNSGDCHRRQQSSQQEEEAAFVGVSSIPFVLEGDLSVEPGAQIRLVTEMMVQDCSAIFRLWIDRI